MRVKLHIKLDGEELLDMNVVGIKSKNTYKYQENDIMVTLKVKDEIVYLNRDCSEYNISLVFDRKNSTISNYSVFGASKKFELKTVTNKLEISDNKIEIHYNLEGNSFKYYLEVKDEGEVKRSN